MSLSKAAKSKWLAACLFSATVLVGFQLQQEKASAIDSTNAVGTTTTTTTVTTSTTTTSTTAPDDGTLSGVNDGSFNTNTSTSNTSTGNSGSTDSAAPSSAATETSSAATNNGTSSAGDTGSTATAPSSGASNPGSDTGSDETPIDPTSPYGQLTVVNIDGHSNEVISSVNYTYTKGAAVTDKNQYVSEIPGYKYVDLVDSAYPDTFTADSMIVQQAYLPLAPIEVRYVDMTNNQVIWSYTMPTTFANVGQTYWTNFFNIPLAGYKLDHDSGNTTGTIGQTQNPNDTNPIIVTYYYKQDPGSTSIFDTSNWTLRTTITPVTNTNDFTSTTYLTRDQLPEVKLSGFDGITTNNQAVTNPTDGKGTDTTTGTGTNTGNGTNTSTGTGTNNGTSSSTGTSTGTATLPDISSTSVTVTTPTTTPTATVTIVDQNGTPLSQNTYQGKLGEQIRPAMQADLNQMRAAGYTILRNGVKGNTVFGNQNTSYTLKVSPSEQSSDLFARTTMPIISELGQASQSTHAERTKNAAKKTPAKQNNNAQGQEQNIAERTVTTAPLAKDSGHNGQLHRDAIANNGQHFGSAAIIDGGGGNQFQGLAAYFISLSGKINMGARA